MTELAFKPIDELAALIHSGEVSSKEVVGYFLDRIESLNPQLNAFTQIDPEGALSQAEMVASADERPFAGVPIAIKASTPVAGFRYDIGSSLLGDFRAPESAYAVQRLKDAGFIVVGTTNCPEFAILPTTEPRRWGPTRNPWDDTRTPGGSSGGSAAAVAAGMIPIAQGTDGGGSIRIPAACCGLVGLKPSRGRISSGPRIGEAFLSCNGVLSRTATETAMALDLMSGYEAGDASWAPPPGEPYAAAIQRDPGRLRIAMSSASTLRAEVDPECLAGMRAGGELLAQLGHDVEEAQLPYPEPEMMAHFVTVYGTLIAGGIEFGEMVKGARATDEEIEPLSKALSEMANSVSALDYSRSVNALQATARKLVAFFADYDVVLTPALALRPLPIGELTGFGENPMEDFSASGLFTPFTSVFNSTGQPAITVPVKMGEDGLPTSIQLVGRPLAESTLLQVAAQIEREVTVGAPPQFLATT